MEGTVQERPASGFETKVRLVVMDFDCPSAVVSEILGVQPTETWVKGQPVVVQAKNVHHENGWMKRSPADPAATSFEDALRELLLLFPDLGAFDRLPLGSAVQLTCTLYAYSERPYVNLSASLLATLGRIGANLDVDIYDLTSTESA